MEPSRRSWLDGEAILQAVSRWKLIPAALALLGALTALLVSGFVQPRGQATLLMDVQATDTDTFQRRSKSVAAELRASDAFDEVASGFGLSGRQLQARTQITPATDSEAIVVSVQGTSPDQAVAATNALAEAFVSESEANLSERLKELSKTTTELMREPPLADATAERARLNRLGEGLAENQSKLIGGSSHLRVLEAASPEDVVVPSRFALSLLGLCGGLLAGLVISVILGPSRGKVRNIAEVRRLFPQIEVVPEAEVVDVLASQRNLRQVAVAGSSAQTTKIISRLTAAGIPASQTSSQEYKPRDGSVAVRRVARSVVALQASANDSTLVVIPVRRDGTEIKELNRLSRTFGDHSVLLMESDNGSAPRKAPSNAAPSSN